MSDGRLRPSRRDALRVLVGAPALAACRAAPAPPLPPGQLLGAEAAGHALRDGAPPPRPAPDRWSRAAVVVIGAGVAGLAAAWRLRRAGVADVRVLELDRAAGGTAQSARSAVTPYPWGAHYVVAPLAHQRSLIALFGEMGALDGTDRDGHPLVGEALRCRDPSERVFFHGRWYEGLYLYAGASARDLAQLRAFEAEVDRWVAFRDGRGRRAFALPMAMGSDDAEVTALDKISIAEWLDARGLTSPRLRWLIDYACRDDHGARPADTSAWAALFYFASRKRAPGAEGQPVVTWPEGNGRLVAHLAAGAAIEVDTAALDVAPVERGVEVVARRADGPFGITADQVVFAAPQLVAARVIRPYRDAPPAHLAAFEYGAWMVANLHLEARPRERPGGFPLAWDNVLHDSPALGYVVATHQSGRDHGPTVLTYYHPLSDGPPREARRHLLAADHGDWAAAILADLSRAHRDLAGLTRRLDVMRWGHGMVRPRPGFVWGGARQAAMRPLGGIHFAHSDLSGLGLFEEALDQGVRAAEEILAARGVVAASLR